MRMREEEMSTSKRGFASMDQAKRREIASLGGKAVQSSKRSFSQDRSLAAAAGRKGGQKSRGGGRKTSAVPDPAGPVT